MRRIIASLDIGTDTIKLVTTEILKEKLNVLSCVEVPSNGIKKGYVVNPDNALIAIKEAFDKTEVLLGIPIKKVLVNIPAYDVECFKTNGKTVITNEDKIVMHSDVVNALQVCVYDKVEAHKELISVLPTKFIINESDIVTNPIGMEANELSVHAVAVIMPKTNVDNIVKCVEKLGVKVVDVCIEPLADYYEFKTEDKSTQVGAIVNIGESGTTVSILNKGILTACEVVDMGSSILDNDLAYIFKVNKKDARYIKEKLVSCDIHRASPAESMSFKTVSGDSSVKVSEYDASAVIISRVSELLGLIKKQINLLTKKEISYIIFSGGLTELKYFDRLLDETYGNYALKGNVKEIGARHGKYSVALGMARYYSSRLKLRNAEFSIFTKTEEESFSGAHKKLSDRSILGKIYGYFFND